MAVTWPRLTQVVEVVVLPPYQLPPYDCHQYRIILCGKGKWKKMETKAAEKDRLGGGGEVEEER